MTRRFEQSTREHASEFWRRINRDVERFARDGLLTLFAAIFPVCFAILEVESLLDRRFHVIVATAFVFNGHSSSVEFPRCYDVIAASAIVIGIFDMCKACGIDLYRLIASGVALDHNFIATLLRRELRDSGERDYERDE